MLKKILILGIILAVVGGGIGWYLFNKPLENVRSMKVDTSISAADLLEAFEKDESVANAAYLDNVVEIKGIVAKIETSANKSTISLDTGNAMSSIICELNPGENVSDVAIGNTITLRGICTGYLMDVVLIRCIIV